MYLFMCIFAGACTCMCGCMYMHVWMCVAWWSEADFRCLLQFLSICTSRYVPGVEDKPAVCTCLPLYDRVVEIKSSDLATSWFVCLFATEPPQCLIILVLEAESHWTRSVFIWRGWLSNKPQGFSCLHVPRQGFQSYATPWYFFHGLRK